jgi:hypothetical protein
VAMPYNHHFRKPIGTKKRLVFPDDELDSDAEEIPPMPEEIVEDLEASIRRTLALNQKDRKSGSLVTPAMRPDEELVLRSAPADSTSASSSSGGGASSSGGGCLNSLAGPWAAVISESLRQATTIIPDADRHL